jgi:hypothetical protein
MSLVLQLYPRLDSAQLEAAEALLARLQRAQAVDPGQPGAREVVAELRRRAAEIRTGAWRAPGEKQ